MSDWWRDRTDIRLLRRAWIINWPIPRSIAKQTEGERIYHYFPWYWFHCRFYQQRKSCWTSCWLVTNLQLSTRFVALRIQPRVLPLKTRRFGVSTSRLFTRTSKRLCPSFACRLLSFSAMSIIWAPPRHQRPQNGPTSSGRCEDESPKASGICCPSSENYFDVEIETLWPYCRCH